MRILFLTDNFPPEGNAPATRTFEHCKEWLGKKNVEVTVITCAPNFPYGKVYKGYKNRFIQKEDIEGIHVIRVWSYMTKNYGFAKRVFDYMSYSLMAFAVGLFQKYDIIVATSPQFFTTWAGWGLSKIHHKPWIFELRDIWPESIKTVGMMKESKLLKLLEKIELKLYKDSYKIIAVTDAFKRNLIQRGIHKEKIEVIPNGSNLKTFYPREKDLKILKALNLENKFIVGYIGTHGMAHDLEFIIQAIAEIEDDRIHFLFIGDGAVKEEIMKLSKKLNLNNITFLNAIIKNKVPEYLSICDISLAPLKKAENFKTVIPSKIFEAAALQKPTLLGVEGQAQEIIEKYHAGLCFQPGNKKDFIKKLTLLQDEVIYKQCQKGAIKLAHAFNRKTLALKMLGVINESI
jgi:hypothetical protein